MNQSFPAITAHKIGGDFQLIEILFQSEISASYLAYLNFQKKLFFSVMVTK